MASLAIVCVADTLNYPCLYSFTESDIKRLTYTPYVVSLIAPLSYVRFLKKMLLFLEINDLSDHTYVHLLSLEDYNSPRHKITT